MRLLIFVLFIFFANYVHAQKPSEYDEHGKRDPFVPLVSSNGMVVTYDQDLAMSDLVVEGIMADASGNNAAIVNGKFVKLHDQIGPYTIDLIAVDHIELVKGNERFSLKLKKGGM